MGSQPFETIECDETETACREMADEVCVDRGMIVEIAHVLNFRDRQAVYFDDVRP